MSRLLFAAARKARIQEKRQFGSEWVNTVCVVLPDYEVTPHRIHPDDAHLQYGPISTALREVALTGDCDDADIPHIRITMLKEDGYSDSTEDQRCVFLLILAECLAEEGL